MCILLMDTGGSRRGKELLAAHRCCRMTSPPSYVRCLFFVLFVFCSVWQIEIYFVASCARLFDRAVVIIIILHLHLNKNIVCVSVEVQ